MKTTRCEYCRRRMSSLMQKKAQEQDCNLPRFCFDDMLEALFAWKIGERETNVETLKYARKMRDAALRKIKNERRKA